MTRIASYNQYFQIDYILLVDVPDIYIHTTDQMSVSNTKILKTTIRQLHYIHYITEGQTRQIRQILCQRLPVQQAGALSQTCHETCCDYAEASAAGG